MAETFTPIESQEQFDAMVHDRVERAKRSTAKEFEEKLKGLESIKKDLEAKEENIKTLQAKLKDAEEAAGGAAKEKAEMMAQLESANIETLKMRIAAEAGIPMDFASRLNGTDAESIAADAENVKKAVMKAHVAPLGSYDATPPEDSTRAALRQMIRTMKEG